MEEQIAKIIELNSVLETSECPGRILSDDRFDETAKEITSHVMEFIEWLIDGDKLWHDGTKGDKWITVIEIDEKEYSIEEAYQYWFSNIKSSK